MLGNQSFINVAQKVLVGPGRGDIWLARDSPALRRNLIGGLRLRSRATHSRELKVCLTRVKVSQGNKRKEENARLMMVKWHIAKPG